MKEKNLKNSKVRDDDEEIDYTVVVEQDRVDAMDYCSERMELDREW